MNRGLVRGVRPAPVFPPWVGGGDPARDGYVARLSASAEGGVLTGPEPYVPISGYGAKDGAYTNNGALFGPDTPGTITSGIQEAINSARACQIWDANGNLISGTTGTFQLLPGVFKTSGAVSVGPGDLRIEGSAAPNAFLFNNSNMTHGLNTGGTIIDCSNPSGGVFKLTNSSFNYPSTALILRNIDFRAQDPGSGSPFNGFAVQLDSMLSGLVENVSVADVVSSGGFGGYCYGGMSILCGANTSQKTIRNVVTYGFNKGFATNASHILCENIDAAFTNSAIIGGGYDRGFEITGNLRQTFINLHAYSCDWGLAFQGYGFGEPFDPVVIHGYMAEACTHYLLPLAGGTLRFQNPIWQNLNPTTDIAAVLGSNAPNIQTGAGLFVMSRDEVDGYSLGTGRHLALPGVTNTSWTAGTSPYTYGPLVCDAIFVLTTVGGMTALTLDGQALNNGTFSVGQQFLVQAGHTMVATWATTAPVFKVLPQ